MVMSRDVCWQAIIQRKGEVPLCTLGRKERYCTKVQVVYTGRKGLNVNVQGSVRWEGVYSVRRCANFFFNYSLKLTI